MTVETKKIIGWSDVQQELLDKIDDKLHSQFTKFENDSFSFLQITNQRMFSIDMLGDSDVESIIYSLSNKLDFDTIDFYS